MSLELKKGAKIALRLKSTYQKRHGIIIHISATSIVLHLDLYNHDENGNNVKGYHNFTFDDITRIEPR